MFRFSDNHLNPPEQYPEIPQENCYHCGKPIDGDEIEYETVKAWWREGTADVPVCAGGCPESEDE